MTQHKPHLATNPPPVTPEAIQAFRSKVEALAAALDRREAWLRVCGGQALIDAHTAREARDFIAGAHLTIDSHGSYVGKNNAIGPATHSLDVAVREARTAVCLDLMAHNLAEPFVVILDAARQPAMGMSREGEPAPVS